MFFMSALPEDEYSLLLQLFDRYEKCELKDQRLSKASRKRCISTKLDFKGLNLKPLRGLEPEKRKELLLQLVDQQISFVELSTTCRSLKRMTEVQQHFMQYLNLKSWEEAKKEYPQHTKDELLGPFMGLIFKKENLPPSFTAFCKQAKQLSLSTSNNASTVRSDSTTVSEGVYQVCVRDTIALVLKANVFEVDTNKFLSSIHQCSSDFPGVTLTVVDPPKVIYFAYILPKS